MQTLLQDLRYGARMLLKQPGFTLIAVLTLALGIGANTTIFSFANSLVLRPSAIPAQEQLFVLWSLNAARGRDGSPVSVPDFADWRAQNRSFDALAALSGGARNLTGAGAPLRVSSYRVSPNFFALLGVRALYGRTLPADADDADSPREVVLSHRLWQRDFGANPAVVGQTIKLDRESFTVAGVMPPTFDYPPQVELWEPLPLDPVRADRGNRSLVVIGRLRAGVTQAQAQVELQTIAGRLAAEYPSTNAGWSVDVRSFRGQLVSDDAGAVLLLLGLVTGCVLLIACVNVANLQLARAEARRKELAVRAALGAGRRRMLRLLLTESVLLCGLGGLVGAGLSYTGLAVLRARFATVLPMLDEVELESPALVFTLALSLLTALLFGLVPALRASRPDLHDALKEGGRGAAGGWRGRRSRSLLIVAQTALALVLLVIAGLLLRTLDNFQKVEPGFKPDLLLTARLALPAASYAEAEHVRAFYRQALERIAATPGVVAAGAVNRLPLTGSRRNPNRSLLIEGRPVSNPNDTPWARDLIITPNYFAALGLPLRQGRALAETDSAVAPRVAVVSETAARRYWPEATPLGQRVKLSGAEFKDEWISIVGVVADVRNDDIDAPPLPQIYLPHAQNPQREMGLVIRTAVEPLTMIPALRDAVWAVDAEQPLFRPASMQQLMLEDLAGSYFLVELLTIFAALALALAVLGIYGVISYAVSQRTQELGIRLALGAQPRDILRLVIRQALGAVSVGLALGLLGALFLGRVLAGFLFGVSATDPATFLLASLALVGSALLACYVPARRATKVAPLTALRQE